MTAEPLLSSSTDDSQPKRRKLDVTVASGQGFGKQLFAKLKYEAVLNKKILEKEILQAQELYRDIEVTFLRDISKCLRKHEVLRQMWPLTLARVRGFEVALEMKSIDEPHPEMGRFDKPLKRTTSW